MKTSHTLYFKDSRKTGLSSESIDLIVTSPPYPVIQMWDEMFCRDPDIARALTREKGMEAFELMHRMLDPIWEEVSRVLKNGGIACINIGDAVRTFNGNFILYPNHVRILNRMLECGLTPLPAILWRKPTNAPNKFMGSGMLPAGAYVTLEHEYILILRKGPKREFSRPEEKLLRRQSAFFWEERNTWFSDVWMNLIGTPQQLVDKSVRQRSGAYPFELPYRLINMFSVKGDTVLDPFCGTGTTLWAAAVSGRNSIGFEIETGFQDAVISKTDNIPRLGNQVIAERLNRHIGFVRDRHQTKDPMKHQNNFYKFPVMTQQETELLLNPILGAALQHENTFEITYSDSPQPEFTGNWEEPAPLAEPVVSSRKSGGRAVQVSLFDSESP
jgi:DNA modification methylase